MPGALSWASGQRYLLFPELFGIFEGCHCAAVLLHGIKVTSDKPKGQESRGRENVSFRCCTSRLDWPSSTSTGLLVICDSIFILLSEFELHDCLHSKTISIMIIKKPVLDSMWQNHSEHLH